jgi:hypothetical protein
MKTTRVQALIALVLACGLTFASTTLFAQTPVQRPKTRVLAPISPLHSVHSQSLAVPRGPLPAPHPQAPRLAGPTVNLNLFGIDYYNSLGSGNTCGCYPPDTNAAVGNGYEVEVNNLAVKIWQGAVPVSNNPLTSLGFPDFTGGDPYVEYDEMAQRWYVLTINSTDDGLNFAVSDTNNPTGTWTAYSIPNLGSVPDYPKMGWNKDAIFISFNNFAVDADIYVIAIDKAQVVLNNNFVYYISRSPVFQFRGAPPAQMHGDTTGGTEWLTSTFDGADFGGTSNSILVSKLTNYLSNNAHWTVYTLTVPTTYAGPGYYADQPGGIINVFPSTTATQLQWHNNQMVTAQAASTAADGFGYLKGLWYEVSTHGGTPRLMQEGLVDPTPGQVPGASVQMPSIDMDIHLGFGLTWMESSVNEYLSMWVGTRPAIFPRNAYNANQSAPGTGFMYANGRLGDYSSTVLDESDGVTYWSANEYIGSDPADYWLTNITSYHQ